MSSVSKLTKAEVVSYILKRAAQKRGSSYAVDRNAVRFVVDSFIDELKEALSDSKIIELRGFGTFQVKKRKGRSRARNPKTGAPVTVEDHGVTVFRPGKELRQRSRSIPLDKLL